MCVPSPWQPWPAATGPWGSPFLHEPRRGYAVSYVKAAVNLLGRLGAEGAGPVRPPLTDLPPEHREKLRATLEAVLARFPGSS